MYTHLHQPSGFGSGSVSGMGGFWFGRCGAGKRSWCCLCVTTNSSVPWCRGSSAQLSRSGLGGGREVAEHCAGVVSSQTVLSLTATLEEESNVGKE